MICSYISGRLGNQFFEYAYSRALQLKRNKKEPLCLNFELVKSAGKVVDGFDDSLKYFNVVSYETTGDNLVMKHGSLCQRVIFLLEKLYQKLKLDKLFSVSWYQLFRKNGILFFPYEEEPDLIIPNTANIFTFGKFGNPKAFEEIKKQIQNEFTPREQPLASNKELYDVIASTNSVCVSIRRGDFLSKEFRDDFLVCDEAYFERAIAKIKERVPSPTFIFFSDDIEWVRENIHIDSPCYYETGKDPVWEKLRLMYSCKHFIVSNSTFSWWTQYLSRNPDKVVVSPKVWMNNTDKTFSLIQDDFITI